MSDGQDADFQEHVRMWRGFTRLMTASAAAVVVILVGMALALL
ncbi:MAG: aa3-type cytochrome c oxidase subunit IV [Alphaproteobacteria bacterium]